MLKRVAETVSTTRLLHQFDSQVECLKRLGQGHARRISYKDLTS